MLAVASYHDVRDRSVPDSVWIAGGAAGAALYALDWHEADGYVLLGMASGAAASLLAWRLLPLGDADALALLAVSVAHPVSFGAVPNPVAALLGCMVLGHVAALALNVRYNAEDLLRGRLYSGVEAGACTRIMAFCLVHKKRGRERFVFCAESALGGARRIDLRTPDPGSAFETRDGAFVSWAMPAVPFMLASLLLAALAAA